MADPKTPVPGDVYDAALRLLTLDSQANDYRLVVQWWRERTLSDSVRGMALQAVIDATERGIARQCVG